MTLDPNNGWIIIGNSVEGASHTRSGKPNQDRIKFHNNSSAKFPIIVAVSDGHGGKPYFRSGTGAQLAVESAIEIGKCLTEVSYDRIKDKKNIDWICRDIVKKWLEKANQDLLINPFTEEEMSLLNVKKELGTKRPVGSNNNDSIVAYGTTLIAAFILDSYILFLQLGDGDVMIASNTGIISKPVPKDSRLLGVETTSLCLPESWTDFRFCNIPINDTSFPPPLIIISTDGYGNSYSSENEFEKIGADLLEIICEHPEGIRAGIELIESNLEDWLNVASEKGSGDDITVGIICNIGQIELYRNTVHFLKKQKNLEESKNQEPSSLDQKTIQPEISVHPDNTSKESAEKSSESSDAIIDQL
ncbi:MAG: PP2C family serine/threonine-protein phosphatase [Methanoregula sp.]|jgi:hypothetical protein|uniref:PP2C family serine/threonine-protein phosphatase n=1 Tax=Methanoregula sp. TaxID=2052170 RepID=UPI003D12862C